MIITTQRILRLPYLSFWLKSIRHGLPIQNEIMEVQHAVTVKLLFFAKSKELAGTKETTISLPKKLTYQQLLDIIVERYNLNAIKNNILLAKNEQVCEQFRDIEICDRDSIAVIPPLSGG